MSSAIPAAGVRAEHRGLHFWMDRVLKELDHVLQDPNPDNVHDLRVALRRCRSVAATIAEIDPDPAWHQMRKTAKRLFRRLGTLRDAQVLEEWVEKLGPLGDPVRARLGAEFDQQEPALREEVLRAAGKFDAKDWRRLAHYLRGRARVVPIGSLTAECLALERLDEARELHARALRTDKPKPWHELRIGIKRFRYTVEHLLPEHHAKWSADLKRLQDLLGDIHDLDVLLALVKDAEAIEADDSASAWNEIIKRERHERVETYRQLTLGKTSLWQTWRYGLPSNGRLEAAAMSRLRATARAIDPHPRRTAQITRIALGLFDVLGRAAAAAIFSQPAMRRALRAASRLQNVGRDDSRKKPQKAARRLLLSLPLPPGWSRNDWELVAWTLRYHRGPGPRLNGKSKHKSFQELQPSLQQQVLTLAGTLRLARALRKCRIATGSGIRAEQSAAALSVRIPLLENTAEAAARLAAAKHLLETCLGKPLLLQPAERAPVVALATARPDQELPFPPVAAASD